MLRVSRPTLRQAIHDLQHEGLLKPVHRHSSRILNPSRGKRSSSKPKQVIMLCPYAPAAFSDWQIRATDEIRKELYDSGYRLELVVDLRLRRNAVVPMLQTLVRQHEADHWILVSLPFAVQKWFQEQRLSAVIAGHTFPGITLPSVDFDQRAVARHAAGIFLGLNHRRIVYLTRVPFAAGDLAAEAGFTAAFKTQPDAAFRIVRHSGEAGQIRSCLAGLFAAPQRPTAILVSYAIHTLEVLIYLLSCNIRVPQDVSLISIESDPVLGGVIPSPAHYEYDPVKLARLIVRPIINPSSKANPIRIIPSFCRGATLAQPKVRA
jgi:LacI family transcriptional regulator